MTSDPTLSKACPCRKPVLDTIQALVESVLCIRFRLLFSVVLFNFALVGADKINEFFVQDSEASFRLGLRNIGECSATWAQHSIL